MNTASNPFNRILVFACIAAVLMAITLTTVLLAPGRSLAQDGETDEVVNRLSSTGPVPVPPLNPPIQTPEPGQSVVASTANLSTDVEARRFQTKVRVELGQPSVLSQNTDKTDSRADARVEGGVGTGPQEAYVAPNYAEVLSPQDWILLVYESFEGIFPGVWQLYDFSDDGFERFWGDTSFWSQVDSWSAWPAIYGADAVDPALGYPNDMDSWLVQGPFDLSSMSDALVGFGLWYDTEPEYDWVYFCVSTEWPFFDCDWWSGYSEGWTDQAYWLTSYAGYSDVWFAWRFTSDFSISGADGYFGPYVDEISIWGFDATAPPPPTPTPDPAGELIENGSFETGDLTGWLTPLEVIQNGGFESGAESWTEFSTHGWDVIVDSFPGTVTPRNGSWAAWLGGEFDDISAIVQSVTIPPESPFLSYWHWIASEDACGYDFGGVIINGVVVEAFNLCADANTNGWIRRSVDLSSYVGQTIQVQIRAETDFSGNSNLFIDDVALGSSLLASTEEEEATFSFEVGDIANRKSEGQLSRDVRRENTRTTRLLGEQPEELKQDTDELGQAEPDAETPSLKTPGDRKGTIRPYLSDKTGVEQVLGITEVGVSDMSQVHGLYAAYLWRPGGLGYDTLYQTINVPAGATDVVLNFWFGVATYETQVGNDWFCASLADPANHAWILVDLGCIDATETAPYWQEVLYSLNATEIASLAGGPAELVFDVFSDVDFYGFGVPGAGATTGWVDYVRVYATGSGAGGAIDPNEPNDTPDEATTISCGETITTSVIGDALGGYDIDWFELDVAQAGRIDIDIAADTKVPPSALDSIVGLWDDNIDLVAFNDDDGSSYDSYVVYTSTTDNATFYISVESYWGDGSADSFYDLMVQCEGSGTGPPPPPNELPATEDTWTVMLYLNAEDPGFESILTKYRTDIEQFIGSKSAFLRVVILYDASGTGGTTRYLVQPGGVYSDGTNRWQLGELNMGDPNTLANFVNWAMDQYPAEHYYLAIDDHGDGVYGISWDPSSQNDQLTPPELYSALKGATRNGTRKIDIFDYEACLMGLAENAYDLREWVDYVVFFEQISWGINTYPKYFGDLAATDSALDVGQRIIDRYNAEALAANSGRGYPHTISLIDTSSMVSVRDAVSSFGNALQGTGNLDGVKNARASSQAFAADIDATNPVRAEYIDLWDLADKASALAPSQAAAVKSAVEAAVVRERHASGMVSGYTWDHSGAHGLSIYYPPAKSSSAFSGYSSLYQMSQAGTWDTFLEWGVPTGRGRGMSSFRTEIRLVDEDAFVFRPVYLPVVIR